LESLNSRFQNADIENDQYLCKSVLDAVVAIAAKPDRNEGMLVDAGE
jgi:hypothetical protein